MKIENYQFPKSSFLSIEKDYNLILNNIMKNQRLLKLLKYPDKRCLSAPDLTQAQIIDMIGKEIKIVPKIEIDSDLKQYLIITFNEFLPNGTNTEFRDNTINFYILCNYEGWQLENFELRPYKIAGEIDSMFNKKHLTGIGDLNFLGAAHININNDNFGGFGMTYQAVHGTEDKK